MQNIIFREYDIRGKVGTEFIIDQVYFLTRAMAYYWLAKDPMVCTIAVGMDGRIHSLAIKKEVCRALLDSGLDVIDIGMCPSPVLYFGLHTLDVQAGIMITASHNPKEYNGMKICLGTQSVWGSELKVIRDLYQQNKKIETSASGQLHTCNLVDVYVQWMADHFNHLKNSALSIVVDCGNGAGGIVMPALIQALQLQNVTLLCAEVDGTYPNHEADPVVPENMREVKELLATTSACVGAGLDGDCDRMAAMTKDGKLVNGDTLLALFARDVLHHNPHAGIVFDVKSSQGLIDMLQQWGAKLIMSPSGHAIIKDYMRKHNGILGGELSCHFFFHDRYFGYDDGIYALLRLYELIVQSGKSLEELLSFFPKKISSPEYRIAYDERKREEIFDVLKKTLSKRADIELITIDGVRATMPYGWAIVRASNTQAKLSLRFESDTADGLQHIKQDFMTILEPYIQSQDSDHILGLEV